MTKNLAGKIVLMCTVLVLSFFAQRAQTQEPQGANANQNSNHAKVVSKPRPKAPEGTSITGNRVKLKPGYRFVTQSDGYTVAVMNNGGVITGSFKCSCKTAAKEGTPGACRFGTVGGDKAQCYAENSCSDCSLETIVDPPPPTGTSQTKANPNPNSRPTSSPTPKPPYMTRKP